MNFVNKMVTLSALAFMQNALALDVCKCVPSSLIGDPCFAGMGGPAYAGMGGPAYAGPGGPCQKGPTSDVTDAFSDVVKNPTANVNQRSCSWKIGAPNIKVIHGVTTKEICFGRAHCTDKPGAYPYDQDISCAPENCDDSNSATKCYESKTGIETIVKIEDKNQYKNQYKIERSGSGSVIKFSDEGQQ